MSKGVSAVYGGSFSPVDKAAANGLGKPKKKGKAWCPFCKLHFKSTVGEHRSSQKHKNALLSAGVVSKGKIERNSPRIKSSSAPKNISITPHAPVSKWQKIFQRLWHIVGEGNQLSVDPVDFIKTAEYQIVLIAARDYAAWARDTVPLAKALTIAINQPIYSSLESWARLSAAVDIQQRIPHLKLVCTSEAPNCDLSLPDIVESNIGK